MKTQEQWIELQNSLNIENRAFINGEYTLAISGQMLDVINQFSILFIPYSDVFCRQIVCVVIKQECGFFIKLVKAGLAELGRSSFREEKANGSATVPGCQEYIAIGWYNFF